jgi:hypothetical protein
MTSQKRDTEVFLQLPYLHSKSGLSNMELFGGAGHVGRLDDCHEIPELSQVHRDAPEFNLEMKVYRRSE